MLNIVKSGYWYLESEKRLVTENLSSHFACSPGLKNKYFITIFVYCCVWKMTSRTIVQQFSAMNISFTDISIVSGRPIRAFKLYRYVVIQLKTYHTFVTLTYIIKIMKTHLSLKEHKVRIFIESCISVSRSVKKS